MKQLMFVLALALTACATTPKVPTNLTAEQHLQAAEQAEQTAASHRKRAAELNGGKGTYTHQVAAEEHADLAKQHRDRAASLQPR